MSADYTLWREEGAPDWRGAGIDGARYTAPARLAAEQERVFARTWQLVGRVDQVAEPGDYFACEVAGEPLLVVRDHDGALRAFLNVCKHRGRELVACGSGGRLRNIACPYHGWCYDLDGRLRAVPDQGSFPDLDVAAVGLDGVAVEAWHGLVFARLAADGESLREYLAPIGDLLAPALEPAVLVGVKSIPLEANWKTGFEAFIETNHIASLHPRVGKGLRFDETAMAHFRRHSLTVVPSVKAADWDERRRQSWREWVAAAGSAEVHYSIFPNVTLHLFAWGLTFLFRCTPDRVDPERMVLDVWSWKRLAPGETPPAPLSMPDAMGAVFQQDYDNIPLVQRGVRSRAFQRPILSVVESRIGHFHAALDACLAD